MPWAVNNKIRKGKVPWNKGNHINLNPNGGYKKGQTPWNKGKKMSPEIIEKNRTSHIGQKKSEETKQKIRERMIGNKYLLGYKFSEESKKKISNAGRGKNLGALNPMWKGGITPENKRIRESLEYKLWVDANFARDGYTCQKTGVRGGKLSVHHILNFSEYPELRFSIDNGITLSKEMHQLFHKIYGTKNNSREQLIEFLNNKTI